MAILKEEILADAPLTMLHTPRPFSFSVFNGAGSREILETSCVNLRANRFWTYIASMHSFSCSDSRTHTAGADVPEHTLEAAILPATKDKQLAEEPYQYDV
jgi:hypothetical protein